MNFRIDTFGGYYDSAGTVWFDDLKIEQFYFDTPESLITTTDYYPGGFPMPGRNVVGDYRYNYQGQELDPETGKVAFQLRLYDPRINRWLTTDPYGQYHSPYVGMGNDWVNGIDPDGGYKTKWGQFWGWVGNGFKGSLFTSDVATGNYKYGIDIGNNGAVDMIYGNNGFAASNTGFDNPVLPPATTFEKVIGFFSGPRTTSMELGLTYNVNNDGFATGVTPNSGMGLMDYQGGKGFLKLGKNATKLATQLFKHGSKGKLPVPIGKNPTGFTPIKGSKDFTHNSSGAIYKQSNTLHGSKHSTQWKAYPKGTKNFGKQQGNRITIDGDGTIIGN